MQNVLSVLTLIFTCVFGFTLVVVAMSMRFKKRQFEHTERMAAIEKGLPLFEIDSPNAATPRAYMLRGMIWLFVGLGTTAALLGISYSSAHHASIEERVFLTQRLRMAGATEQQLKIAEQELSERTFPMGFALLGLIPMGVGLAFLMFSSYAASEIQGRQMAAPIPMRK